MDISPLRESRSFRLLFTGHLTSLLGSQLTIVAIAYQIYALTGSSLWVGLASLIQLPFLIWGSLWGGATSDRVDKRKVLAIGGAILSIFSAGLALNAQLSHPHLWIVIALSTLAAFGAGFVNPSRNASIPRLVRSDQLVAAYSINQVVIQIATVVGPALSGLLVASSGVAACYWIDVATFVVFSFVTLRMDALPPSGETPKSAMLATRQGLTYLRSHRIAQAVYVADLNAMIFGMPRALFPAVALTTFHGGPRLVGLLFAAPGAGALLGALTTGWVEGVERRGRAVVYAVMAWGLAIAVFGLSHSVTLSLVALAVAGWADVISAVLRNAILQSRISDEFRGRLSAIQMAVVTGGPRLGDLEAGAVASAESASFSVISGGLACVIGVGLMAMYYKSFWEERASQAAVGGASDS